MYPFIITKDIQRNKKQKGTQITNQMNSINKKENVINTIINYFETPVKEIPNPIFHK